MTQHDVLTFQGMIAVLQDYWSAQGCIVQQPYDMEVGAGTFHSSTFLRAIGPEPWNACHTQASRRPTDGRYGDNPNRLQHYYQFQVAMKPSPKDMQNLYLGSLKALGFDSLEHDIRFVEDNWESPTLGAWGLGELAYGIERLAMYIQKKESIYDLVWGESASGTVTYGDVFHQNEAEQSAYNFEHADVQTLFSSFEAAERDCKRLTELQLPLPAYEHVLRGSHVFNMLDARHALSVTERQGYILRVRTMARQVAQSYQERREAMGYPLLKKDKDESLADAES